MNILPECFGEDVFGDKAMRKRLPKETYDALRRTIKSGKSLDRGIADAVANAMKDFAVERGATHFTHWFQPMTGVTAEKHESFLSPTGGGGAILEFSGKELVRGEPDASSFPSGGLRSTFEARGYTTWDATSYAFIKDGTLCIPTAFCSYSGEALDKKTPLLRSMEALDRQALRVLRALGDTETRRVDPTVGPEQEYFLVDKALYLKRKDLIFCGRTLFGAKSLKGQELDDHYLGALRPRVQAFMHQLDEALWKLGVSAKTEHNEVAPGQHELAPVFTSANIATDHNQLTMELMRKVADANGLACLLHEKPFAGVNGSGKHNNWSLSTDTGKNLFEPGERPAENTQFLLFLAAVIQAVDAHQDLLRVSVASAGNDHRLGSSEAPPAILSLYMGSALTALLDAIKADEDYDGGSKAEMRVGVHTLPRFLKDDTDRNRTSPFAFTGNKFEFRMVGSSFSVAGPNITLNTIVAEALSQFADRLEPAPDKEAAARALVREVLIKHGRILFGGNNYSKEWEEEAKRRGLLDLKTTVDALPYFIRPENIALFEKHKVYSEAEIRSRYEILMEKYCKTIQIEAMTMVEMVRKNILPVVTSYAGKLSDAALSKRALCGELACQAEGAMVQKLSALGDCLYNRTENLENLLLSAKEAVDVSALAVYYKDSVLQAMGELRAVADELEVLVGEEDWPIPTYGALLFSV